MSDCICPPSSPLITEACSGETDATCRMLSVDVCRGRLLYVNALCCLLHLLASWWCAAGCPSAVCFLLPGLPMSPARRPLSAAACPPCVAADHSGVRQPTFNGGRRALLCRCRSYTDGWNLPRWRTSILPVSVERVYWWSRTPALSMLTAVPGQKRV